MRPVRVIANENIDPQRAKVAQPGASKRAPLANISNIKRPQPTVKPAERKPAQVTVNSRPATKRSANTLTVQTQTKKPRPLPESMEVETDSPLNSTLTNWRDIDAEDHHDAQMVSSYANSIYSYLNELEVLLHYDLPNQQSDVTRSQIDFYLFNQKLTRKCVQSL